MKELLTQLAEKYEVDSIIEKLNNLEENLKLKLGFLGEFSSGKSTLINALLEKNILPSMEKPTTKSITEILIDNSIKDIEFFKYEETGLTPIEPIVFQEIALGKTEGKCLIKIKPSDILKDGYFLVDTPGISSIDKTDVDITFGYLPFLDGAIICQDINYGTLTNSILDFLKKPEIAPIANNFLFVLTKTDLKDEKAVEKIKKEIITLLEEKNREYNLGIHDIEKKVVAISAKKYLETKDKNLIKEFKEAFDFVFIKRRKVLESERIRKELKKIAENLIFILEDKLSNLELNDDELKEKEKQIKADMEELNKSIEKTKEKLNKLEKSLENALLPSAETYAAMLSQINDSTPEEEKQKIFQEIFTEINDTIQNYTEKFFEGYKLPKFANVTQKLAMNIEAITKLTKIAKIGATAWLTAAIGPATSIGKAAHAGDMLEGVGGTVLFQGGSRSKKAGKLSQFLAVLKEANPIEHIGNFFSSIGIYFYSKNSFKNLLINAISNTKQLIYEQLEMAVFDPVKEQLIEKENNLRQLKKEKIEAIRDFNRERNEIEKDITNLKLELQD